MGGSVSKSFFNFVAFIAMTLIGIALLLGYFFDQHSKLLFTIAEILAYCTIIFYGMIYAWTRGKNSNVQVLYVVWWAIASALIVIFMILTKI